MQTKKGWKFMFDWLQAAPRRVLVLLAVAAVAMLGYGLYLQHVVGLNPCPMCIVQRYALVAIALIAALTSLSARRGPQLFGALMVIVAAAFGAFVAARQSWLQWYPPEVASCGRDFYGMIETFPLQRAIPMIFKGGGDCSQIDWTFLGLSLANWSFVTFAAITLLMLAFWVARQRRV